MKSRKSPSWLFHPSFPFPRLYLIPAQECETFMFASHPSEPDPEYKRILLWIVFCFNLPPTVHSLHTYNISSTLAQNVINQLNMKYIRQQKGNKKWISNVFEVYYELIFLLGYFSTTIIDKYMYIIFYFLKCTFWGVKQLVGKGPILFKPPGCKLVPHVVNGFIFQSWVKIILKSSSKEVEPKTETLKKMLAY